MILNIYRKLKLLQIKTTYMHIRLDPISTSNSLTRLLISKIKSNKTTNVRCSQKVNKEPNANISPLLEFAFEKLNFAAICSN